MVSMVSPRQAEDSDDLLVVDSPPMRGRLGESSFSDRPPFSAQPSFARRASRGLIRFLIACGVGVAGTLAWQSYGDAAKQTIATFGAEHGLPMEWLSYGEAAKPSGSPAAASATQAAPRNASAPDTASASDLQQVKTMTLGLAASLTAVRERIDQIAAGQEQTASDVAKLQAAEQDIRHKLSAASPRPAAPAPSKPPTAAPPRALTPPR